MNSRDYITSCLSEKDGRLFCESCDLVALARQFGTPLYVYSRAELKARAKAWVDAVSGAQDRVFFAMKANSTKAIVKEFFNAGIGADIVSGGELTRALHAGLAGSSVVYSGVGKRTREIAAALEAGILCFNIESESELYRISNTASELGKTATVSFRVNPDVDAKTHPYISTGLKNNKFGIAYHEALRIYKTATTLPGIRVSGIDAHIGSQLTDIAPFVHALEKILDIVDTLAEASISLDHIDVGGGLGIRYTDETPPSVNDLVTALRETKKQRGYELTPLYFEPGRHLVAPAGLLLTRVEYLKPASPKNFCIVDASMTEMIRPALYQANMPLFNAVIRHAAPRTWDIVGPVCESSDWLAKNLSLTVRAGDVLVMPNAGAYGSSMASTYNSRALPAEVMVEGDKATLIRTRSDIQSLMDLEYDLA